MTTTTEALVPASRGTTSRTSSACDGPKRGLPFPRRDWRSRATASGAHLRTLSIAPARAFLERLGLCVPFGADLAIGAFEDNGALIGVAVVDVRAGLDTAVTAVVPARRRLGVATDLWAALRAELPDSGPRTMSVSDHSSVVDGRTDR